jgi:hypothetical protein
MSLLPPSLSGFLGFGRNSESSLICSSLQRPLKCAQYSSVSSMVPFLGLGSGEEVGKQGCGPSGLYLLFGFLTGPHLNEGCHI